MSSSDEEDGCEDDDEDWMFQTFTGGKKGGKNNVGLSAANKEHLEGMAVTTAHHAGRIKQEDLRNNRDMHHDLDGGLGSSYEENSNSSPFDLPSEIMSKQF